MGIKRYRTIKQRDSYSCFGHYNDTAYLKARNLYMAINSIIRKIESSNNGAYDWREEKTRERYYENDGP